MNIANRIKQRMSALNLTQESVANRAGISQGMVHKLVSGNTKKTSKLIELAMALECDVQWLATGVTQVQEAGAKYAKVSNISVEQIKQQIANLPPCIQKEIALAIMESLIEGKTKQ